MKCFLVASPELPIEVVVSKFPDRCRRFLTEDVDRTKGVTWVIASNSHPNSHSISTELGLAEQRGGIVVEISMKTDISGWVDMDAWTEIRQWMKE